MHSETKLKREDYQPISKVQFYCELILLRGFFRTKEFKKWKKITKVILTWEKVEIFIYKHSQKYNLQFRIDFFVHCICVSYICEALHQLIIYTYQLSKGRSPGKDKIEKCVGSGNPNRVGSQKMIWVMYRLSFWKNIYNIYISIYKIHTNFCKKFT